MAFVVVYLRLQHTYQHIISLENLLEAWKDFARGKRGRTDVQQFERHLMANLISLHHNLVTKAYRHASYHAFRINDPKPRQIHKASVRDRVVHRALYRQLYWYFHQRFISDSYSCRVGKGTHKALERFRRFAYQVSANHTRTCWVLKCDIKKFFASIDQATLLNILQRYVPDQDILWLLQQIIFSFHSTAPRKGLPLGNLTSQLLVNIYMNEFDQFVKHDLKQKYYLRYADDFVLLHHDKAMLEETLPKIADFLTDELKLTLHPDKVFIKTLASGVDFLGWVHFTDHRVLRTATKRWMFKKRAASRGKENERAVVNSYLGMLGWGNGRKLQATICKLHGAGV